MSPAEACGGTTGDVNSLCGPLRSHRCRVRGHVLSYSRTGWWPLQQNERETGSHLAIVLDNVDGVAGLLTLTDVLQRLLPVTGATA